MIHDIQKYLKKQDELYRVIDKKTNQECYFVFCFIETFVRA
jgi:hypothetical protein